MTKYCETALKLDPSLDVQKTLSSFASEHFHAPQAFKIDDYQFDVDNAMNDLRAVLKPEIGLITFCCRYEKDIPRIERKLNEFIEANGLEASTYNPYIDTNTDI